MACKFHASEEGGKAHQDTCGDCQESGPAPDAPTQEEVDSAMQSERETEAGESESEETNPLEGEPVRGPRGARKRGR